MANTFPPLVSSASQDAQGVQQLNGSEVLASCNIRSVVNDLFFNPTQGLTGFAFNGFYYTDGVATTQQASWASEGSGVYRGATIEFPASAMVLATEGGLTIFDQTTNSFSVWMSFIQANFYAMLDNYKPTKTLRTGTLVLDGATKTIVRTEGSWVADGVLAESVITLTGLVLGDDGNYTVVGPMDDPYAEVGIIVTEVVTNEEVGAVVTMPSFSRLFAKYVGYANGVVSVGLQVGQGSEMTSNVFVSLDFLRDEVYSNFSAADTSTSVVVSAPASWASGDNPITYTALASTLGRYGDIFTYAWAFEDGTTATGASVDKTWSNDGPRYVVVTATNTATLATASVTKTVVVRASV